MTDMEDEGITTSDIEIKVSSRSSNVQDQVVSNDDKSARVETDTTESSTRDIDAESETVKGESSIRDIDAHGKTVKWESSTRDFDACGKTVKGESSTRDLDAHGETVKVESSTRDIYARGGTVNGKSSIRDICARGETVNGESSTRDIDAHAETVNGETVNGESSTRDIDAHAETVNGETVNGESSTHAIDKRGETDTIEPVIDEPSTLCQTAQRTYGCMVCKKKTKLKTFNNNSLERGDHIQIKGRLPIIGITYNHHAIISDVSDITEDGKHARVQVVDVSEKAKEGCHRNNIIPDINHKLNDMKQVKCSRLVRLDYRKRRHNKEDTYKRAEKSSFSVKYCCLVRNCEHFATACVGGKDIMNDQGIKNSISLQSRACGWKILNCVLQIVQLLIYIFNFYIYASFAAQNDKYNHFPDKLSNWLEKTCQNGGNVLRGFDTICDWVILAICVVVFSVLFGIMFCRLFFKYYKKNYMCKQCLLSTGCVYVFRVVLFVVFDVANILIEMGLYHFSLRVNITRTIVIIVIVAIVEGIIIYVLAHYITKWILLCSGKSCCWCSKCCGVEIEEDSYKYAMSNF